MRILHPTVPLCVEHRSCHFKKELDGWSKIWVHHDVRHAFYRAVVIRQGVDGYDTFTRTYTKTKASVREPKVINCPERDIIIARPSLAYIVKE